MNETVSELMCRKMSRVYYVHMLAQDYRSLPLIALQNDTFLCFWNDVTRYEVFGLMPR